MSRVALPHASLSEIGDFLSATAWAAYLAVRPAKLYHHLVAVLETLEVDDGLLKCLYACHAVSIRIFLRYVKYIITSEALIQLSCDGASGEQKFRTAYTNPHPHAVRSRGSPPSSERSQSNAAGRFSSSSFNCASYPFRSFLLSRTGSSSA